MKPCRRRSGMTLVELIVALVVLAVVAAIAIPSYVGYIRKADEKACVSQRQAIMQYYENYKALFDANAKLLDYAETNYGNPSALCPAGGQYVVKNNTLLCTAHDHVDADGNPLTGP